MEEVDYLIAGAGVTGLAFANALPIDASWLCIEKNEEAGGYCRTVRQDGFIWDYSGHFFHFRHPEIEKFLLDRMSPDEDVKVVQKQSSILYGGERIDFPFQKNIHQLPKEEFIECLCDLYFREKTEGHSSFEEMLYGKFGKGITEKFLKPYNEKLYACSLGSLDADAMGRFFPYADFEDILRNMRAADNESYNATFTYPAGGAIQYVNALLHDLDGKKIRYREELLSVDVENRVATTSKGRIKYRHLLSALPLPRLLHMTGCGFDRSLYSYNKVLVFNIGFNAKGQDRDHWIYIPDRDLRFYRVGFYDNIFGSDRMSLYVEIGMSPDESVSVEAEFERTLVDLKKSGIVTGQDLVSWHSVLLDPAYVHIHKKGQADANAWRAELADKGVHSAGRYGAWKYCSIEDNILEARELASRIS